MKELEKILKLLELSASDNDGEALNAIRKANEVRNKAGLQWNQVLEIASTTGRASSMIPPVIRRRPEVRFVTVETMLRDVLDRTLPDMQRQKIEEIRYSYEFCDSLSGDEINFLINTYNHF